MKDTFNGWLHVGNFDLENVVDLVITDGTTNTINSDMWITPMIGDPNDRLSLLDFGCGVGRNIFDFSHKFKNWKFHGYDNPNMLKKAKEYSIKKFNKNIEDYPNLQLFSEWDALKSVKFDCVYATIVFQHIYEKDLNIYLQDIKKMTNRLIVSGRRFNDDSVNGKHKNTWQILENNGLYPSNDKQINYKTDGDPDEHITCIYDIRS